MSEEKNSARASKFKADDAWQRAIRDRMLAPFYEQIGVGRYVFLDGDKGSCAMAAQKELGIDTVIAMSDGTALCVEEKIVRWPKSGKAHDAFALETWSCTVQGREKEGWLYYSAADRLLYCFEQQDSSLLAYNIPMQPLRAWALGQGDPVLPYDVDREYPFTITDQINRSMCRVVPISDVLGGVASVWRYLLAADHFCWTDKQGEEHIEEYYS